MNTVTTTATASTSTPAILSTPAPSTGITTRPAVLYEEFFEEPNAASRMTSWISGSLQEGSYEMFAKSCDYRGRLQQLQDWATIQRLKPSCQVFLDILQYVKNSCSGRLEVQQIYRVDRKNERAPFTDPYRIMLWHGTKPYCVPGILQKGLVNGSGGMFGGALYFADRIAKSQGYAQYTSQGSCLFILAEVAPGKVYKANKWHSEYSTAPQGFDSVKGTGQLIPTWKENKQLYGAILPCGKSANSQRHRQYQRSYNEYVLYSPDRAIVRYIVECRCLGF